MIGIAATPVSAARAEPDAKGKSCTINTHGQDEKGNLVWDPKVDYVCYDTFAESAKAVGADVPVSATPAEYGPVVARADGVIGVHYDYYSGGGTALTVTGSNCGGGGLNVPTAWNDRISSTLNGCPTIVHWENFNFAGSSYTTFGVGNLTNIIGYMDNRTTAIKYYS